MPDSMPDSKPGTKPGTKTGVAVVGIAIGVVFAIVGIVQHRPWDGFVGLAIMVGYVALLLGLRRRSETAQLLGANPVDERQAQIMRNASATTGQVVTGVLTVWWLGAIVTQADYLPVLTTLTAVAGFSFMGAVFWHSRRG